MSGNGKGLLPNIRILSRPCAKCFKLAFRLAHPRIEEVELAQSGCAGFSVTVDRIEASRQ